MEAFRYKSNCTRNRMYIPFASDSNMCHTKTDALKYMKNVETNLAIAINEHIERGTLPSNYYVLGDYSVIAVAKNYDDAALIAEALAAHSPYYNNIDVMCRDGLVVHFLSVDCHNDRTNHALR